MPQFAYSAVDASGRELSGTLEAPDRPAALRSLSGKGLQPFKVAESATAAVKGKAASTASKSSGKAAQEVVSTAPIRLGAGQIQLFTEELSELLEAGMRLEPALKLMEGKGMTNPSAYRLVARRVGNLVREGHPFSSAIRMASPSFGELFCAVAAAGEAGGSLAEAMKRQAAYMAASRDMQGKVVVALIYPGFLAVAGLGVVILFTTYLIPKLMGLIESTRGKIPPLAKAMINGSEFLKNNWLLVLLLLVAAGVAFWMFKGSKAGKPVWHKAKLKIPFVGAVLSSSLHSQFLETLASLASGGLPLLKGLDLASRVTTNVYAHAQLQKSIDLVKDGGALSRALERTALFPSNLIEMVRLGDLPAALRRAADRCAKELGRNLEKVAAAMQPVIILIMAGVVGIMAYLMISIIFDTLSALRNPNSLR